MWLGNILNGSINLNILGPFSVCKLHLHIIMFILRKLFLQNSIYMCNLSSIDKLFVRKNILILINAINHYKRLYTYIPTKTKSCLLHICAFFILVTSIEKELKLKGNIRANSGLIEYKNIR
jgi:hypothetical protein